MQHTGSAKDKTIREKERNDLRVTVGENIVRLSSLEGVSLEIYKETVLPRCLEVVLTSKDSIAQQYLIDCIIQAFPDEYHLNTLNDLLETTTQLQPTVDIKGIFINLLNRLSNYAAEADLGIVSTVNIFELIKTHINKLLKESSPTSENSKFLQIFVGFLRITLKCYSTNTNYVSEILDMAVNLIEKENSGPHLDTESLNSVSLLLTYSVEYLALAILDIKSFPKLMSYLLFSNRKKIALKIVKSIVFSKTVLNSVAVVKTLIEFIGCLVVDTPDTTEPDIYEFEEEQEYTSRLVHLVYSTNKFEMLNTFSLFKEKFALGGNNRQVYSYPALIFAYLKFVTTFNSETDVKTLPIIITLQSLIRKVSKINPELGYKLNLQAAL